MLKTYYYDAEAIGKTLEIIVKDNMYVTEINYVADDACADQVLDDYERVECPVAEQCLRELEMYFRGGLKSFGVPIAFDRGTEFQQLVWNELRRIPFGETISYKTLAMRCSGDTYSRAVANANGKNPISIIVPCHRVISSDGSIGGYTGGLDIKEKLLKIEGAL